MQARHFSDSSEEPLYRRRMDENPGQFVLNTHKSPSPAYLILHRVGSSCLAKQNPLLSYSKLCGDRAGIEEYVGRSFGFNFRKIDECGNCFRKWSWQPSG